MNGKLGVIVLDNCKEFGEKVNQHLKKLNKTTNDFTIKIDQVRFNNGEGKVVIKETIREKHVYILSDVCNNSCEYKMFNYTNHMSPDDHFQDIKRVVSAISGNAKHITLIMLNLYASRQHKRKGRESLDCAVALQELERLGVRTIITFDAHDPNVQNAIPCMSFENFYPTHIMLEKFIHTEDIDFNNLLVVSPDTGAMDRARYYADMLKCDVGMFYKRRDLSVIIDGKNPIVAHEYIGKEIAGKDIIVVDDMVSSGDSIIEVGAELKKRNARNIYVFCTFGFFTRGVKDFDDAYRKGYITKFYTTNLTYVADEVKSKEWFVPVDCSSFVANIINTLNKEQSLSPLLNGKESIAKMIQSHLYPKRHTGKKNLVNNK